jgi:hypothetical protein
MIVLLILPFDPETGQFFIKQVLIYDWKIPYKQGICKWRDAGALN